MLKSFQLALVCDREYQNFDDSVTISKGLTA